MADWSIIKASQVARNFGRIDGEYYRPKNLEAAEQVMSKRHERLGRLLISGYRVVYENTTILPKDRISTDAALFLQATDIDPSGLDIARDSVGFVSASDWQRYPKGHIRQREILIEVKGQAEKVSIVPQDYPPRTLVSGSLFKAEANESLVSPEYLFAFLASRYGRLLRDRLKTNTLIGFVSKPQLYSIPVLLPSEAAMEGITNKIRVALAERSTSGERYKEASHLLESELELDKISVKRRIGYTASASEMSESLRTDAEFYDPIARAIGNRIEQTPHSRLAQSFSVGNGFPWKSSQFLTDNSGEPVVRIRNIRPSHINPENLTSIVPEYARSMRISKAKSGDIVVGMDGIKYFYASLLRGDCYVNQRVAHLTRKPGAQVSAEYATFILNSRIGQAQLMRDMTVATTVGHITNRDIRRLIIPTVSPKFHDTITDLVCQSIEGIEESRRLLEKAKSCVEKLVEEAVSA